MSDETIQILGSKGNIYEENPSAQKELPLLEEILNPKLKADPSSKLEAAGKAAKVLDGGPAAPDHGKAAGAGNAVAFHNWKKEGE